MGKSKNLGKSVVLFDGVCNLCNRWVRFVIRRDPREKFVFAPLQSRSGKVLLEEHGLAVDGLESVVLVENGRVFLSSDASLRIARQLRFPWPAAGIFLLVPKVLRDCAYGVVARNRYQWFGRRETCQILEPGIQSRFLE